MTHLWLFIYPMMASDSLSPNGSITLKVVAMTSLLSRLQLKSPATIN